ncbi:hypothetical protein A2715_05070 [Candidatus Woesebacteria bacterium RIFCSPHIGHO2_01_FULL_39_32]|uniref:Methyltransferase type 11 domain-containing protein n=1 Tax=Candidatus Woesebacteria bacterium RIFCSPLOWO2_01_FULL_39_25 TaxID=1802521 RepID=A0A1F8BLG0_9BACT|nr:MAG: hypothetical protein A2124_05070 [Candidatus Woesebacteria bacterium GWB1_37_5]OGM25390.1 MAG: hypothetical protein A2715_05070 [Candidatus Woesebacteria bacterium RIFCSPHIGHO2_01_FULL_39_32]OGM38496.1 MAG: hypothetical protein A3F01_04030 [Candidatus Woesebacteria bacterium RIFCSPHIGHO2_12_FULL_38_11]OGM64921.1 MAG: hypothetical protein A2893_04680 [Candidatus Woesebacteria bacterium RIFCSPLOWO2_01_FULL_39_25]
MDKVGEYTLQIMKLAGWYNNWLFSLVKPYLKGKILEVGTGIGNFTYLLAKEGEVTSIDIDKVYINKLKKSVSIKVGYGDIEKGTYFFSKKKFDCIVCMNVLEHIKNDSVALENMLSLLKPKGRLILLIPAHKFAYGRLDKNLGHYRRYSKGEIVLKLVGSGFKVKKLNFLNFFGIVGWFLNSRLLKRDVLPSSQLRIFDLISRPFLFVEKFIEPRMGLSILVVAEK